MAVHGPVVILAKSDAVGGMVVVVHLEWDQVCGIDER